MLTELLQAIVSNSGYLNTAQIDELTKLDRLRPLLVRCGNGRFTCAAQDATHFANIIDRDGADYVRDISLPATDAAYRGDFDSFTKETHKPKLPPVPTDGREHTTAAYSYTGTDWIGPSDADMGL